MLETAQTGSGKAVLKDGKQWQGRTVAGNKFPLRHYIGSSDRSVVFSTELGAEKRIAAIKLIAINAAEKEVQLARLRFAAKLSHPHLLQIFDTGSCTIDGEDLLFVVMEYADETLAQILPERCLTGSEVREMLKPALEALAYIHENGFAHGHLRPSNILVVDEKLKLSSDGLCRPGVPSTPAQKATLFEAPEASRDGFSPAGDAWSLGVTLTQALTQRLPVWNDRLREEPWLASPLPEPFSDVAKHCMLRDAKSRWTMAQISARLDGPAKTARANYAAKLKPEILKLKPEILKLKPANFSLKPGLVKLKPHVLKLKQQILRLKPEIPTSDSSKLKLQEGIQRLKKLDISTWGYASGMVAVIATAILLASSLRHRSEPRPHAPSAPAAVSTSKPSPHPGRTRETRTTIKTEQAPLLRGDVVRQVVPDVSPRALRTIHGKVRVNVRVHLDSAGNVARAEFASFGPSRYFASRAMDAAQSWKFAQGRDSRVWLLQFVFDRSGSSVHPEQITS
ncbi:MAG TPA: protein kinase [Terriglobales bacterium]|nr:protein kinase [Terriglobales bacterium]